MVNAPAGISIRMEEHAYADMARMESVHWWYVARRKILSRVLAGLDLPSPARLVELGCGSGGNLAILKPFGHLDAMEPHDAARKTAHDRGIADVRPGLLPDQVPFVSGHYDLVAGFDLVEHTPHDVSSLKAMIELARPGGLLIATVPAYPFIWSDHDVSHHHFRRYTKKTLREAAAKAGLKIERVTYFNTYLFPLMLVRRLMAAVLRQKTHDDQLPAAWLNRLLAKVFAMEAGPIGSGTNFPFGGSLLLVGRRPASSGPPKG